MSHVCDVDLHVQSIDDLEAACKHLGLHFDRNAKSYRWYGSFLNDWASQEAAIQHGYDPKTFGRCEHRISHDSWGYDIGVVVRADGKPGFSLIYDAWGNEGQKIRNQLGAGCEKLKQRYGSNVTTRSLRAKGYRVKETVSQDGSLVLRAVR